MNLGSLTSPFAPILRREAIDGTRTRSAILAGALTALPLALLVASNYGEIAQVDAVTFTALGAALVAGCAAFALGFVVAPHVAGIGCGVLGYAFFSMSWTRLGNTTLLFGAWLSIGFFGTIIFLWLIGDSARTLATAASLSTAAVTGLLIWGPLSASGTGVHEAPSQALAYADADLVRTPNVYLFVLDAFSNPTVIEEQFAEFDVDLNPSITRLEALGFDWEEDARANYAETRLSVPSMLNANYPLLPGDHPDWDARLDGEDALRGHNATVQLFTDAGYDYWHSGSGIWGEASCDTAVANRCIGDDAVNFETFSVIWANTPLRRVLAPTLTGAQDPAKVVSLLLDTRAEHPSDRPLFFFSHMLMPHQPYRFDRNCAPVESTSTLSDGGRDEHRSEYAEQVLCAAAMLAESMDQLIAADPEAIIILQGDHGASFTLTKDPTWEDVTFRERIDILRMTRLPDDCRYDGRAAQSLINTLPVLHACLTQTKPVLITPRILVTNYSKSTLYEAIHPDDRTSE